MTSGLAMTEQLPIDETTPPKKLYHGSPGIIQDLDFNYRGFHVGTYKAALDRRSGQFGSTNWNKLRDTISAYVDKELDYNSNFAKAAEEAASKDLKNPYFYQDSVFYKVTTDKDYTHELRIIGYMDGDTPTMRLYWCDDNMRSYMMGMRPPLEDTTEFAQFIMNDIGEVEDIASSSTVQDYLRGAAKIDVPENFTNDYLYEVTIKDNPKIAVVNELLVYDGTNFALLDADNAANNIELFKFGREGNVKFDKVGAVLEMTPNMSRQIQNGIPLQAVINNAGVQPISAGKYLQDKVNADLLAYKNVVEDNGSTSYIILKDDKVDIQFAAPEQQVQFQLEVDQNQTRTYLQDAKIYTDLDLTDPINTADIADTINSQYAMEGMRKTGGYYKPTADARIKYFSEAILPAIKGDDLYTIENAVIDTLKANEEQKKKAKRRIFRKGKNIGKRLGMVNPLAGGPLGAAMMEALDYYETLVMIGGLAYAFAPDTGKIVKNSANHILETMANAAGYNIKIEDYDYDWRRVNNTLDWIEAVSPTDIVLNKAGKALQSDTDMNQPYMASFGEIPMPDKVGKTLTTQQAKDTERDPMYDRIIRTFSGKY